MQKKYIVNGKEYNSLSEVPAEHRASLETFEKMAASGKGGFFSMIRLLFSMAFKSIRTTGPEEPLSAEATRQAANLELGAGNKNTPVQGGKGFLSSRHFRVMLGMLTVAVIVYLFKINRTETEDVGDATYELLTDAAEDSEETIQSAATGGYRLFIDDPNEPPYRAFVGLYDETTLLLRLDLPDGSLEETPEKNVISLNESVEGETDLLSKHVTLTWKDDWNPDDSWSRLSIRDKTFFSLSQLDYGAGQRYRTQYYAYPYGNGCVMIEVLYHLQNADVTTDGTKFDVQGDLKQLEELLSTLHETEKTP